MRLAWGEEGKSNCCIQPWWHSLPIVLPQSTHLSINQCNECWCPDALSDTTPRIEDFPAYDVEMVVWWMYKAFLVCWWMNCAAAIQHLKLYHYCVCWYPGPFCFTSRFREVSKPQDPGLDFSNHSEIWQAPQQYCCRDACQISGWCNHDNTPISQL